MKVSKRIKEIASFIDISDKIIYDVGCDHALLDIYLANIYSDSEFNAIDVSEKCIESANITINNYGLKGRIKTLVNNGLSNIKIKKNSTLVISGMGTYTIIEILNNCDILKFKKIIIQSNNDLELLRRFIVKKGFIIKKEKSLYDKKYYVIIEFVKGICDYNYYEYIFGPNLIENIKENKDYFEFLYKKYNSIYKRLPFFNIRKRCLIFKYLNKIKKLLKK